MQLQLHGIEPPGNNNLYKFCEKESETLINWFCDSENVVGF